MAWTLQVLDNFTDTAATPLASHTPDTGSGWVVWNGSDFLIFSPVGTSASGPAAAEGMDLNNTSLAAKQAAEAQGAGNSGARIWGVMLRVSGSSFSNANCYFMFSRFDLNKIRLSRLDSGAFTTLAEATGAVASTDIIRLEADGSSLAALYNGSALSFSPVTDATYATGKSAIYCFDAGAVIDYFKAYDDAGSGGAVIPVFMNQYRQRWS